MWVCICFSVLFWTWWMREEDLSSENICQWFDGGLWRSALWLVRDLTVGLMMTGAVMMASLMVGTAKKYSLMPSTSKKLSPLISTSKKLSLMTGTAKKFCHLSGLSPFPKQTPYRCFSLSSVAAGGGRDGGTEVGGEFCPFDRLIQYCRRNSVTTYDICPI